MTTPVTPVTQQLRLHSLANQVLTAATDEALDLSITLPGKRYVTTGQAVHDCEQVAVVATRIMTGIPDARTGMGFATAGGGNFCQPTLSVVLTLEIARCFPNIPEYNGVRDGAKLSDAMKVQSGDAAVIFGAVERLVSASRLDNFGDINATINFPAPSGEFVVTIGTITIGLP